MDLVDQTVARCGDVARLRTEAETGFERCWGNQSCCGDETTEAHNNVFFFLPLLTLMTKHDGTAAVCVHLCHQIY